MLPHILHNGTSPNPKAVCCSNSGVVTSYANLSLLLFSYGCQEKDQATLILRLSISLFLQHYSPGNDWCCWSMELHFRPLELIFLMEKLKFHQQPQNALEIHSKYKLSKVSTDCCNLHLYSHTSIDV